MKREWYYILMIIAAAITIYGLLTGRFLFLFLMLPFGFGIFKRNKDEDNDESAKRLK